MAKLSKPVRYILILVLVLAVVAAVTGIAYFTAQQNTDTADEQGLYLNGERVADPGVVMTVGDVDVSFDDYYYQYMMNLSYTQMFYGENFWENDYDGAMEIDLRNNTVDSITEMIGWLQLAEERGVTLSDEEKQEVVDTMAEQKESLGEEGFAENLASMYMIDEAMYVRVTEEQKLADKMQEEVRAEVEAGMGDTTAEPDTEGMATAKHILIAFDEEAEDPTADEAAALSLAEELVAQIRAAEADEAADADALFDELMLEYGEDPGVESNPDGYTFGEGEMVDEFYEGSMALAEGEVSEPIRTDYGYHIIKRLPLSESYLAENAESMREEEISTLVDEELQKVLADMPVSYGQYFEDIRPENMK